MIVTPHPFNKNNMELIEKIRAEVERLKGYYRITNPYDKRAIRVCENLLSFLDTLEAQEPEMDLVEELDAWRRDHLNGKRDGHYSGEYLTRSSQLEIARHFAAWGAEHLNK